MRKTAVVRKRAETTLEEELAAIDALPPYPTKSQTANALGLSTRTIERKIEDGELEVRHWSKRAVRVIRASVRAYVIRRREAESDDR
jgi:hypothetical protein